jgi:thymidylate synthase (FAD)
MITGSVFSSNKFKKMRVQLIDAPDIPEKVIAATYLECIEDRNINGLADISNGEAQKITQFVLEGGHTPSLESVHLTFTIRGISRILSHQLVRHRVGTAIGQRTQRANCEEYLGNFYKNSHFILPPSIDKAMDECVGISDDVLSYLDDAEHLYNLLIRNGVSQDDARYIIPHCAETSMTFTVAYKSLMHICSVRMCHLMQGEMVEVARLLQKAVSEYCPMLGEVIKPTCLITGRCNRNENNPTVDAQKGVCHLTVDGTIPIRKANDTFNLTKYSRDNSK